MANKNICPAEQLDTKEILTLVDDAASMFAHARLSFADARTLFEAITAATAGGSLASRLAQAGMNICEEQEGVFEEQQSRYDGYAESFEDAVMLVRRAAQ